MERTIIRASRAAVLASVLLAGCATQKFVADNATTYNKALERANNQELLLNVLRASKRRPLYFSYISQVHGGAGLSLPSAGVTLPFGPGSGLTAAHSVSATFGYVGTSSFDVGALDSQEFMRGITSPVDMQIVDYYWREGWPHEMLWYLLVEKIEITSGKPIHDNIDLWASLPKIVRDRTEEVHGAVTRIAIRNYPENAEEFAAFKGVSALLLDTLKLGTESTEQTECVGPPLDVQEAKDPKRLASVLATKGISLKKTKDKTYQLVSTKSGFSFSFPKASPATVTTTAREVIRNAFGSPANAAAVTLDCEDPKPDGKQKINVYIRSPEAIVYYLGEIMRAALGTADHPASNPVSLDLCNPPGTANRKDSLLFDLRKLEAGTHGVVDVEFDDERYGVPADPPSASQFQQCSAQTTSHVLSFLSQLISLQRSAKDLPTTGVVHVTP